jgi:hypothetical protein
VVWEQKEREKKNSILLGHARPVNRQRGGPSCLAGFSPEFGLNVICRLVDNFAICRRAWFSFSPIRQRAADFFLPISLSFGFPVSFFLLVSLFLLFFSLSFSIFLVSFLFLVSFISFPCFLFIYISFLIFF